MYAPKFNYCNNLKLERNILIRKPTNNDIARTAEIHVYGWRYSNKDIISDVHLYNHRLVEKTIIGHRKILHDAKINFDLYDDGIIKGFILHHESTDLEISNAYEINTVYVEPAFLRNGIGKKLIVNAENSCKELGKKKIFLWVLEKNNIGRKFYEKNGYTFDGTKKVIESWNLNELRYSKNIT